MDLDYLDYCISTLLNARFWSIPIFENYWYYDMTYILGETCYFPSFEIVLWAFFTLESSNIQCNTLIFSFAWYIYICSIKLQITLKGIWESNGSKAIYYASPRFTVSDSHFYYWKCSRVDFRMAIGIRFLEL